MSCGCGGHKTSSADEPDQNNNRIIEIQSRSVDFKPTTTTTKLTFYGHASFKLESAGGIKLLFDPWQNDDSGFWGTWYHRKYPKTYADIALSTHDHFDHNALDRVIAPMKLDRLAGKFSFGDVEIEGIADKHTVKGSTGILFDELRIQKLPPNNPPALDNTMFLVTTGGLRILFWGDNRFDVPKAILPKITNVDVLIIPIDDSEHLMTYDQVETLVKTLKVKSVVPCHYLTKGVGSCLSTLKTPDKWVANHKKNLITVPSHTQEFTSELCASWKTFQTVYFGHNLPFEPEVLEEARLYCKAVPTYN